jgi:hypothetical protein
MASWFESNISSISWVYLSASHFLPLLKHLQFFSQIIVLSFYVNILLHEPPFQNNSSLQTNTVTYSSIS